ncbi:MAG TPA: hypothetical protein VN688_10405 [Gemmataceae bacterium]|nr:hypothetical protein [Gemmataceae bacterium]
MAFAWCSFWKSSHRNSPVKDVTFRPTLETLEARDVPSANPADAFLGQLTPGVVPIHFNFVVNQGAQVTAIGQVGVNPVMVPLTLTATPGSNGAEVLHLHLNPIHLDVLGLNVQTSNICLDITAQQGSGNVFENLIFDVAHALDTNGQNVGAALGGLGPIKNFLFNVESSVLLNGGLSAATSLNALGNTGDATNLPPRATDLVHLSLGPVNLNLLGLNVALDNCSNGPVVVDAYAQSGSGELLGNLLTSVANILNPSHSNPQAEQVLANVVDTVLMAV